MQLLMVFPVASGHLHLIGAGPVWILDNSSTDAIRRSLQSRRQLYTSHSCPGLGAAGKKQQNTKVLSVVVIATTATPAPSVYCGAIVGCCLDVTLSSRNKYANTSSCRLRSEEQWPLRLSDSQGP
eukprot:UN3012